MNDETPRRSSEALINRGEALLKARPLCPKMLNDLSAAALICKMHAQGFAVSIELAEECIRRMQIAVDTGIYPDELLRKAGEVS